MTHAALHLLLALLACQQPVGEGSAGQGEPVRHERPAHPTDELASWLSRDLRSARERWAEAGVRVEALLTTDLSSVLVGGRDPGATALRGLLDVYVTVDGARVLGLPGGELVVGVQAYGGDDGTADVGALQCVSSIDAPDERVQVAHLWYEQAWGEDGAYVRVGKMDANAWFAAPPGAEGFVHSSMTLSPTLLGVPTWPDTSFGAMAGAELADGLLLELGVFDGAAQAGVRTGSAGLGSVLGGPDDAFLVAQATAGWGGGSLALGAWHHTGAFARYDGGEEQGTEGAFAVLAQRCLEQRRGEEGRGRTLDAFLQLGNAREAVSPFALHVGLGVVARRALLPERDDALGLGVSHVQLSDAAGAGFTAEAETALEAYWEVELAPGLRLAPDLQCVLDPGGDAARDDAWLATLRLSASL